MHNASKRNGIRNRSGIARVPAMHELKIIQARPWDVFGSPSNRGMVITGGLRRFGRPTGREVSDGPPGTMPKNLVDESDLQP